MKLDENKIQYALTNLLLSRGHFVVIPNVSHSWLYWEADLISITKSRFMYEFEIKISKADFQNDFKKRKHRSLRAGAGIRSPRIPNYFTYVAPIAAVPICIPDHAGLVEVAETGWYGHEFSLPTIKKAPLLHRTKQTDTSIIKMLRTLMYKYWNLAHTLNTNKIQKELFTK